MTPTTPAKSSRSSRTPDRAEVAPSYEAAPQQTVSGLLSTRKGTWATGGGTLTAYVTCPGNATEYYGYTYANNKLDIINPSSKVVATWTKQ